MPRKSHNLSDWTSDAQLLRIQHWAMHGMTLDEIAAQMEISRRTLSRWLKVPAGQPIQKAISLGAEVAIASVENKLFQKAQAGELGAICFFLKNRAPQLWSDHPELKNFDGKVVFVDDVPSTAPSRPAEQDKADKPNPT